MKLQISHTPASQIGRNSLKPGFFLLDGEGVHVQFWYDHPGEAFKVFPTFEQAKASVILFINALSMKDDRFMRPMVDPFNEHGAAMLGIKVKADFMKGDGQ
ncbi:hypothetical protein [Ralstonia holmesii]|uniref:hypothetical protein n=1 Tax=Ralstonia holmesii TaxID=3058602 RepID=UPI003D659E85